MRILASKTTLIYLFILCLITIYAKAQDRNLTLNQDPKFEQLLSEKRKINVSITVNEGYKIQIYSGDSENAKKNLVNFKQEFESIDATITFNTPNYRVWVGSFKNRIEAERNLITIRKKYKNALLIRPNK